MAGTCLLASILIARQNKFLKIRWHGGFGRKEKVDFNSPTPSTASSSSPSSSLFPLAFPFSHYPFQGSLTATLKCTTTTSTMRLMYQTSEPGIHLWPLTAKLAECSGPTEGSPQWGIDILSFFYSFQHLTRGQDNKRKENETKVCPQHDQRRSLTISSMQQLAWWKTRTSIMEELEMHFNFNLNEGRIGGTAGGRGLEALHLLLARSLPSILLILCVYSKKS